MLLSCSCRRHSRNLPGYWVWSLPTVQPHRICLSSLHIVSLFLLLINWSFSKPNIKLLLPCSGQKKSNSWIASYMTHPTLFLTRTPNSMNTISLCCFNIAHRKQGPTGNQSPTLHGESLFDLVNNFKHILLDGCYQCNVSHTVAHAEE